MSNYQNRIDFISRTRQILVQYEHNCNSEKTLFMNCCVGLLIMPQQCADHDKNISVDGLVDYENWGIDTTKITANEHRKGVDKNSIENIAYHIRNSICHYRFDIMNCNVENIENIQILTVPPINQFGSVTEIIKVFGSRMAYEKAIKELENELYKVA